MNEKIRTTTNHLYTENEVIGQGATSNVFIGHDRKTGEKRALKISKFNHNQFQREIQREIEAFLSLRHTNIVAFYGIEEEIESGKHVIVMEYCSGGSLYSLLQEPENINGLDDSEILILLQDLSEGLQCMITHGFAHRDIKPGNILRSININGRSVYKISDFGTCRQQQAVNEDEGRMMSLVGTEEYLHPNIYKKAFIQRDSRLEFSQAMDIWSLGVTLYHASCGEVPFQPFGGPRKDKQQMYKIISMKPRGMIRGFQETEHGKINWSQNFPITCRMSVGLQMRMERIVSGLMEASERHQWSCATFFDEVSRLKESSVIIVLNTTSMLLHRIYVDTCASKSTCVTLRSNSWIVDRLAYLKEIIASLTEIEASDQQLFYKSQPIEDIINTDTAVKDFPTTTDVNPILLVSSNANKVPEVFFRQVPVELMSNQGTLASDLKIAKIMSNSISRMSRFSQKVAICQFSIFHFVNSFSKYLKNIFNEDTKDLEKMSAVIVEKISRLSVITEDPSLSNGESKDDIETTLASTKNTKLQLRRKQDKAKQVLRNVKHKLETLEQLDEIIGHQNSDCSDLCRFLSQEAKMLVGNFKLRSKTKSLNSVQELQLKDERRRMNEIYIKTLQHWKSCCFRTATKSLDVFHDWNRKCQLVKQGLQEVEQIISNIKWTCWTFENNIVTLSAYSNREWSTVYTPKIRKSFELNITDLTTDESSTDKTSNGDVITKNREMVNRLRNETTEFSTIIEDSMSDSGLDVKSPQTLTIQPRPKVALGTNTAPNNNMKYLELENNSSKMNLNNDSDNMPLVRSKRLSPAHPHRSGHTDSGLGSLSNSQNVLELPVKPYADKTRQKRLDYSGYGSSQKRDKQVKAGQMLPEIRIAEHSGSRNGSFMKHGQFTELDNFKQKLDETCRDSCQKRVPISRGIDNDSEHLGKASTGPPFTSTSGSVSVLQKSSSDFVLLDNRNTKEYMQKITDNFILRMKCPRSNASKNASIEESHEKIFPERDKLFT